MEIKNILVSQPLPANLENSPFTALISKYKVKFEYIHFIKTERVTSKEFRLQRVDVLSHTAILFTSRSLVDVFFALCEECRIVIPETMKYFCVTEAIALYLQKYIVYRKRKVFFGKGQFVDLMEVIAKHPTENFLLPLSEPHKPVVPKMLTESKVKFTKAILSKTISVPDLKDKVTLKDFDLLLFYSPAEMIALHENFGEDAKNIRICAFGVNTALAIKEANYNLVSLAPTPDAPSMVMSVDKYLKQLKNKAEVDLTYIDKLIELSKAQNKKATDKVKVAKVRKTAKPKAPAKSTTVKA